VPYLVSIGYPGVTADCTVDINNFVTRHISKFFVHPVRKNYVKRECPKSPIKINRKGFDEVLRIATVKIENGIVRLGKIRGVL